MKKNRAPFRTLLMAVLLLLALPARGEGMLRGLVIGCEPASARNAEAMEALLKDFWPGGTAVRTEVPGPGSVGAFEVLIRETFGEAGPEDTSLLYLGTHGMSRPELPGGTALLLSDGEEQEDLPPQRLREILDGIPGRKILILDACRSGALIGRGTETGKDWFDSGEYRVLVSAGAEEDSWFWTADTEEETGTGYFTGALENALRASDPDQIDPDGDGTVSLKELTARLREIHGASTVYCRPEENGDPLFILPEDRKAGGRLRGLTISDPETEGETLILRIHFRAEEPVRVTYELVPSRNGRWDFEHAVRIPDREKTGLARGLLSPGEKDRTIRLSRKSLGEDGKALMQMISLRGEALEPAAEAGRKIEILPEEKEIPEGK